jgi:protein-disulfide isomerase
VERRAGIAITAIVLLLGARVFFSRGGHLEAANQAVVTAAVGTEPIVAPTVGAADGQIADSAFGGDAVAASEAVPTATVHAEPNPAQQTSAITVDGVSDIDPHKAFGSKSAPIVLEIFSDYQCPACRTLFLTTNRQLMDNYVSTGKVFLVHRDFPLPMHAHSRVAAQYARAAAEIGKIEPVEKVLFENQEKWEQTGDVDGTVASVLTPPEMAKVRALVKGGTLDSLIEKDVQLGQMYRVNQTPTSVFHSKGQTYPYSGVMSWDILRQFLDQLLGQK